MATEAKKQNCLTICEFVSKCGLDIRDLPICEEKDPLTTTLERMSDPIETGTYGDKVDILLLAVKVQRVRRQSGGACYGVLALHFRKPRETIVQREPGCVFVTSTSFIAQTVNANHNKSGDHTGSYIDACPKCPVLNDWWKIDELIKIVKRDESAIVTLL